jgi:hypothetical protein
MCGASGNDDMPVQAAVGDDLDAVFGEQSVDQHAVVLFGIPDAQLAEHRDPTLPRVCTAPPQVHVLEQVVWQHGAAVRRQRPVPPGARSRRCGSK